MSYLQFDQRVWQVEPAIAARQLYLLNAENGKVAKSNDCLSCCDESLCEGANHGRKHRARKYAHIKVKSYCEAANEH